MCEQSACLAYRLVRPCLRTLPCLLSPMLVCPALLQRPRLEYLEREMENMSTMIKVLQVSASLPSLHTTAGVHLMLDCLTLIVLYGCSACMPLAGGKLGPRKVRSRPGLDAYG